MFDLTLYDNYSCVIDCTTVVRLNNDVAND